MSLMARDGLSEIPDDLQDLCLRVHSAIRNDLPVVLSRKSKKIRSYLGQRELATNVQRFLWSSKLGFICLKNTLSGLAFRYASKSLQALVESKY